MEQARRDAARAAAQERAERERQAADAADAVRQVLPCEVCGLQRSAGLCEACGIRRRTEAAIVEAGLVAATWSADLDDPGDVAAVAAHVRASLEADIAQAVERQTATMRELSRRAFPEAEAVPHDELAVIEQARAQRRRQAAATEAAALRRAREEKAGRQVEPQRLEKTAQPASTTTAANTSAAAPAPCIRLMERMVPPRPRARGRPLYCRLPAAGASGIRTRPVDPRGTQEDRFHGNPQQRITYRPPLLHEEASNAICGKSLGDRCCTNGFR
ncbi:hypothetical protein [Streptomyces sp. DSM 118148]|uniref:hypothetical protein n=1 Tax=Streptomyces sp. DSM 118148 TaxID=3448667 RepID=UPI00403FDE7F